MGISARIKNGGGRVKNKKITSGDYRFIEKILYDQKTSDTAIAELQAELDEMVPSATSSYVVFDHNQKNPKLTQPEAAVAKRVDSVRGKFLQGRIAERKRHQRVVKDARKTLSDTENQLVWLYYDLEKSARDCWRTMGYEKTRWYEIKNDVVIKVARFLGLI